MSREPDIYRRMRQSDTAAVKQTQLELLDMARAQIEDGKLESIALLMVARGDREDGCVYRGSRFLVRQMHLDIIEDLYNEMIDALAAQYGTTPDDVRRERRRKPS